MKVILKKDIAKIGLKGEVKEVSGGYARNYLFPKGLADPATKGNLAQLQHLQEIRAKVKEKEEAEARQWVKSLAGKTFNLEVEVGERGQLFESIDATKIAHLLTEEGFSVEKNQVLIEKSIKELGNFQVEIKLTPEIIAKTKIKVSAHSKL
jgi:large subunit ribosomal protein L9